jgi:hypothetical protein
MDWPSARRILLAAFFITDLILLGLRFGPGQALVPALGGVENVSSVVVTPGLDLAAEPYTSSLALPVVRAATFDPNVLVLDALGELPPPVQARGGTLYRGVGVEALVRPDESVEVDERPPERLAKAGSPAAAATRLLAADGLGVPFGPPHTQASRGGVVVSVPETTRDGTPVLGAGATFRFDRRGRLVSYTLRLVTVVGLAGRPSALVPGATAVLMWAESRPGGHPAVVRDVRLGYVLPEGAHGDGLVLPPAWIIVTDGTVVAVDARTGEVMR